MIINPNIKITKIQSEYCLTTILAIIRDNKFTFLDYIIKYEEHLINILENIEKIDIYEMLSELFYEFQIDRILLVSTKYNALIKAIIIKLLFHIEKQDKSMDYIENSLKLFENVRVLNYCILINPDILLKISEFTKNTKMPGAFCRIFIGIINVIILINEHKAINNKQLNQIGTIITKISEIFQKSFINFLPILLSSPAFFLYSW